MRLYSHARKRVVLNHVDKDGKTLPDIILPKKGDDPLEVNEKQFKLLMTKSEFRAELRRKIYWFDEPSLTHETEDASRGRGTDPCGA
jgi:hypothetical protein